MGIDEQNDIAAPPTIATVRPAARLELLAPEGRRAVAALARFDMNLCPVYQHLPRCSFSPPHLAAFNGSTRGKRAAVITGARRELPQGG